MKLEFKNIIDKERGKIGVVCGLGPSLKNNLEQIIGLSDDYCVISCNDTDIMAPELQFDYWVIANSIQTVETCWKQFNGRSATLVYADTADWTDRNEAERILKIPYLPYDQRHFENKDCLGGRCGVVKGVPRGCDQKIPGRLTIQEELMNYCGDLIDQHYGTGSTVALHMLALAILLGLNPIYITGVDLDYNLGYINGTINGGSFEPELKEILQDFSIIKYSAKAAGVEIINLSKNSLLNNIFKTQEKI